MKRVASSRERSIRPRDVSLPLLCFRAAQDGKTDHVHVFLHGGRGDHLRGLMQPGIDDLHARIAERRGDDLGATIVAVEAGLGNENSYWTRSMHGIKNLAGSLATRQ